MCIICVDFQKQLITINEARNILTEMVPTIDKEHFEKIDKMLKEAE